MKRFFKTIKHNIGRIVKVLHIDDVYIRIKLMFKHEKTNLELEDPRKLLNDVSHCPEGDCKANNQIKEYKYDLQIIVPAYNVQKFLRDCMESIVNQKTRFTYKVVLIDDGSTDLTGSIADEYKKYPNIEVIHQENRGFSGARNRGLEEIWAKYICFVDSDDLLCQGAIESLMSVAVREDADIVEGGAFSLENGIIYKKIKHKNTLQISALNNLTGFPWGKVWRSEIFETLKYPEGFWFEDSIFSFLVYPDKKLKVFLTNEMAYIYRDNPNGITNTARRRVKCIDSYWITEMLMEKHKQMGYAIDSSYHEKVMRQIILNYNHIQYGYFLYNLGHHLLKNLSFEA